MNMEHVPFFDYNAMVPSPPFEIQTLSFKFQMVGLLLDFRFHSTSRPFANQPLFDHSEFGRVQISDHTVS